VGGTERYPRRVALPAEGYEEAKISLDEYLDWMVSHQPRSFSRAALTAFMLAQSQPYPEMVALMRSLRARYGLTVAVVTNDGRKFLVPRRRRRGLRGAGAVGAADPPGALTE
jgi:putative hydrolase of the HAD superfamily